jgi:hypothetical protein
MDEDHGANTLLPPLRFSTNSSVIAGCAAYQTKGRLHAENVAMVPPFVKKWGHHDRERKL